MPAIPPNSLIAITGITGYIASYIGLWALRGGHRVRGTVRSWARADSLKAGYEKQGIPASELAARLEFVIVDDLFSEDQWTAAFKDVDGIVHVALNIDIEKATTGAIVEEAVASTLSVFRAAKKYSSVKRVVITSSMAAVTPPMLRDKVVTTEDWNDEILEMFEKGLPVDHDPVLKRASFFFPYSAAKLKSERAAWEFVKQAPFDMVSILPGTNTGPMLHGELAATAEWTSAPLRNDVTWARLVPPQWCIDVRDCARLHYLALVTPSMGGKRFLAIAHPFGWNQIFGIYRKNFPDVQIPEDLEGDEISTQKMDIKESTELLGGWISLEQSLIDLGKSLGY